MSLYPCVECGQSVSSDTTRCLNCGAAGRPHLNERAGGAVFVVLCIVVFGIISAAVLLLGI